MSALRASRQSGHVVQGAVQIDEAADLAGRCAGLAQMAQARVAGAFGELAASRIGHQAMVGVDRLGMLQQDLKQTVQIGGGQKVEAARDMGFAALINKPCTLVALSAPVADVLAAKAGK